MLKLIIVSIIRFYRKFLSPLKLPSCRFYPTCSEYAIASLEKYGLFKGIIKSLKRVCKCHPFHPGGYDPA
jgi:uncharacterized protein